MKLRMELGSARLPELPERIPRKSGACIQEGGREVEPPTAHPKRPPAITVKRATVRIIVPPIKRPDDHVTVNTEGPKSKRIAVPTPLHILPLLPSHTKGMRLQSSQLRPTAWTHRSPSGHGFIRAAK